MKLLKAKRAIVKGTLTRILAYAQTIDENVPCEEYKTRLDKLEAAWTEYREIQYCMLEKVDDPDEVINDPDAVQFEDKYYKTKVILQNKISSFSPKIDESQSKVQSAKETTSLAVTSQHVEHQLPKIVIKPFTGELCDWITFHDLFTSSVHNSKELTSSQKFHFLKSFLDGQAAGLLKHTLISDDGYLAAWEKLKARYDRKGLIASSLIQKIFSLPSVSNSYSLRKFTDEADELLRGLEALGKEAEQRDVILNHLLISKLDADTKMKWAETTHDEDFPQTKQFFEFLEQRCDSIVVSQDTPKARIPHKSHSIKTYQISNERSSCPKCKLQHDLNHCPQFTSLDISARRHFVKQASLCFNCLRSGHKSSNCNSKFRCRQCSSKHHTLVHQLPVNEQSLASEPSFSCTLPSSSNTESFIHPGPSNTGTPNQLISSNAAAFDTQFSKQIPLPNTNTLLPTALVLIPDVLRQLQACRVLLDCGSQASFISESCVRRLGINRKHARFPLTGVSGTRAGCTRGLISTQLFSRFDRKSIQIEAYILSKVTESLPSQSFYFSLDKDNSFMGEKLADPGLNIRSPIDVILGVAAVFQVLEPTPVQSGVGFPDAVLTMFGWVFGGNISMLRSTTETTTEAAVSLQADLDFDMQRFWELDDNFSSPLMPNINAGTEEHFLSTYSRSSDGRFVVELPFKSNIAVDYGDSYSGALRRLLSNERKFDRDPELKASYCKFMCEYIALGHMEEIESEEIDRPTSECYYLPHHPVFKADSSTTKLRVVFDGSYKSSSNLSLNETLSIGPPIQRDLFAVIFRYRRHKYTLSADIEKMFRQIWVAKKHHDFQRILWRTSSSDLIKHFRLKTVTYGTTSAPYLAVRILKQLALDSAVDFPRASQIIEDDFYVDDLLTGADTVEELFNLRREIIKLLGSAGLNLRKWSSNCKPLLDTLPADICEQSSVQFDSNEPIKLLGLLWNPSNDSFRFRVSLPDRCICTKRQILSDTSRIFDPLGFLTPTVIALKIIFQGLWKSRLSWDDSVPNSIAEEWRNIRSELSQLQEVEVPRRIWHSGSVEYHGFCDASLRAYSAVIYSRSRLSDGTFVVSLVAAKSRVAPIKTLTIPRLELCAAVLLCRLFEKLRASLKVESLPIYAWTDSQIVIHWLSSHPSRWAVFISNRVSEISSSIPRPHWNYVPSKSNPADCASRGIHPSKLKEFHLWWNGPSWLSQPSDTWPEHSKITSDTDFAETDLEMRRNLEAVAVNLAVQTDPSTIDCLVSRSSSFVKLIRTLSFCFRFITRSRSRSVQSQSSMLTTNELQRAKIFLLKKVQYSSFSEEQKNISQALPIHSKSTILNLMPFLDNSGLLRVGGRIQNSSVSLAVKHPIILPKTHAVVVLIVRHYHEKYMHVGAAELFSLLRREFWIIGCRNIARKIVHDCVICAKQRKSVCSQIMGNLPPERVKFARPFSRVGVDFAGPVALRLARGRRPTFVKSYIALFVCFVTKAIHLELVGALTTDAFLAALNRFVARRGKPSEIFSDNGTNFKGAYRRLTEMHSLLLSEQTGNVVIDHLSQDGISWQFIPPSAPHFGGLWEAGVKSVKLHLKRVIGEHVLTYEEMYTLLTRIEALLNSRPLCARSDHDFDALTPAHFLIGEPLTSISEPTVCDGNPNLLSNWQRLQHMAQGFWKRWHSEYLTSLQNRPKWTEVKRNIMQGDIVIVKEPSLPQSKWILGIVKQTNQGRDGHTRVATIKTSHGEFVRPITKLVLLPVLKD